MQTVTALATRPAPTATPAAFRLDALLAHVIHFGYRRHHFFADATQSARCTGSFAETLQLGVNAFERGAFPQAIEMLALASGQDTGDRDIALFYLGMSRLRSGDAQLAFDEFTACFRQGKRIHAALLEAGSIAVAHGDDATALNVFRLLISVAGNALVFSQMLEMAPLRFYSRALAEVASRIAHVLRPCSLTGPRQATLSPRNDRVIGALLDSTFEDLLAGRLRRPELAGRWPAKPAPERQRRVLLIFAQHINCSQDHIDNDVLHHLSASGRERGHLVEVFHADRLLYGEGVLASPRLIDGEPYRPSPAGLARDLARLQATIESFQPDMVLFEANFIPTTTTLTPAFFRHVPSRRRFSLVAVVPDFYDTAPDLASAWTPEADHVLSFNEVGQHAQRQRDAGRLIFFPSIPFIANPFRHRERPLDFVFVGGSQRGRDAVLSHLAEHVPRHRIIFTDRHVSTAFARVDDFYDFMAQGKVTFNTGFLQLGSPGIQTGRTVEAMLSRTALLEEFPAALRRAFVPFLHFVPVDQVDQAVAYTQFLCSHPAHRTRLVDAALAFVDDCYSPAHFWTQLESMA
jgi:hypothetical protein